MATTTLTFAAAIMLLLCTRTTTAFAPVVVLKHTVSARQFAKQPPSTPSSSSSSTSLFALPDISNMKAGEIRQELESYGINTKSFLEKTELVTALEQARAQGKTPIKEKTSKTTTTPSNTASNTASNGTEESTKTTLSREERMKQEMEKAARMKVADLKQELQSRGISTRSFFEKSEFVKAYAEAIVDGKDPINGNNSNSKQRQSTSEPFDPEYRDVVMQKMSRGDPRLLQGTVIDVTPKRG